MEYEIKVRINGKVAVKIWDGKTGLDATRRYQDAHADHTVIAWRDIQSGLFILGDARQIIG